MAVATADPDVRGYLLKAQRHLEAGQFEAAREAIERGYERDPADRSIREMFQQVLFAYGIRQARRGRDLRRDSLRGLGRRPKDWAPSDTPEVQEAFQRALDCFERVLQVNPGHAKAVMMKGATLYRMDRHGRRAEVRLIYQRALESAPDSQELRYALDMIDRRCGSCRDTGQCLNCGGTGQVSAIVFRSTCPQCRGSGVCPKCAIL